MQQIGDNLLTFQWRGGTTSNGLPIAAYRLYYATTSDISDIVAARGTGIGQCGVRMSAENNLMDGYHYAPDDPNADANGLIVVKLPPYCDFDIGLHELGAGDTIWARVLKVNTADAAFSGPPVKVVIE